jgi:hypothetical protein
MNLRAVLCSLFLLIGLSGAQANLQTFEGIDASTAGANVRCCVIDMNGAVGTKQYLEWVDSAYQGYNKTAPFAAVTPVIAGDTPWLQDGPNCQGYAGNGVILFDHLASRWIVAVRQGVPGTYYYCIAISNTDDLTSPTFQWYSYVQPLNAIIGANPSGTTYFPDYPKIGTWPNGYYVSFDVEDPDNSFQNVGVLVCAFDRSNMLKGNAMRTPQCFNYPSVYSGEFLGHSVLPADVEGTVAPAATTPETLVSIENPSTGTTSSTVNFWQFNVNWTAPTLTTFTGPTAVKVPSYTPACYTVSDPYDTGCVPEPTSISTGVYLDSLGDRLMHRLAYHRFPTAPYNTFVVSQTIQVAAGSLAQTGVRWYEFEPPGKLLRSGTVTAPGGDYRFLPSAAQDQKGNLALGFSVSGTGLSPSIHAAYLNLRGGSLVPTEFDILTGTADDEYNYRWGGYSSMTVDPVDDCTFWYVNEYFTVPQIKSLTWQTRIANFHVPGC